MKLPLHLDGHTVRDANGRVVISALNPCTDAERAQIVAWSERAARDEWSEEK